MKKTITFLFALMMTSSAFAQQDTIAKWTFSTGNMSDTLPDVASSSNQNKYVFTEGGTSAISMKNGATTSAAQVTNWNDGADKKSWQVEINTIGFIYVALSSKQTTGDKKPGPVDFKIQYKLGAGGTWTDIAGSTIKTANDWTTGVIDTLQLPSACNNQSSVYLRWLMTSIFDSNGDTVLSSGTAKIDDIIITGDASTGCKELSMNDLTINIFPNPSTNYFNIETTDNINNVRIYNICGSKVYDVEIQSKKHIINTSNLKKGLYFVAVVFSDSKTMITRKITVR